MVTGANGFIAQSLIRELLEQGFEVVATGKGSNRTGIEAADLRYYDADITDPFALQEILAHELPEVVVHSAAMSQVDECEKEQNKAHSVNVEATARLLLDAEAYSSFFVFLSTDFVFDGERGNYTEDDEPNPVSWYGHTKLEAEAIVQTASIPWAIVRTCLVYGEAPSGGRSTIYSWLKTSMENGKAIKVVDDQWRTPTYVKDLALGIRLLIQKKATGIFHISGEEYFTPFRMGQAIAAKAGYNEALLERVTANSFQQAGKRPLKTGFDISKARRELDYAPRSFDESLTELLSANRG